MNVLLHAGGFIKYRYDRKTYAGISHGQRID